MNEMKPMRFRTGWGLADLADLADRGWVGAMDVW